MLKYPWHFRGTNYHVFCYAPTDVNLSFLKPFNHQLFIESDLHINKFIITFSHMTSTVNSKNNITYNEVIIKVPLEYKDNIYTYPIVTFVNDELSLIRGYFLGFKKLFANIYFGDNKLELNYLNINCHIDFIRSSYCELLEDMPDSLKKPFILFRDFSLDNFFCARDIVTLDVENFELEKWGEIKFDKDYKCIINNIPIKIHKIYSSTDRFKLNGVKNI